jgi:hypothetical protein
MNALTSSSLFRVVSWFGGFMFINRLFGASSERSFSAAIIALLSWLGFTGLGHATDLTQSAYIKPETPVEGGYFGQSVFLNPAFLAVGAVGEQALYTFTNCTSPNWEVTQRIIHPNGQSGTRFGQSIVGSREWFVAGAPREDGDVWGENPGDFPNAGAVYVYDWNGQFLENPQRVVASNHAPGSLFGWSVDLSESGHMIVGAQEREHGTAGRFAGAAYIYEIDSSGEWIEVEFFESPNPQYSERFGNSVQISDSWAFVGAKSSRLGSTTSVGAVYVYERTEFGWEYRQELVPESAAESWSFGYDISLDHPRAAIGAIGAIGSGGEEMAGNVYIYELVDGTWVEDDRLEAAAPSAGAWFGGSVALDGKQLAVGAFLDDSSGFNRGGSAHLFTKTDQAWASDGPYFPNNIDSGVQFGTSVTVESGVVAVGAIGESSDGTDAGDTSLPDAGAAYLFSPFDWLFRSSFETCQPLQNV